MDKIDLSIIVPVYNVEKYLDHCVSSLIEQDISKEIILINDGSTDMSGHIAHKYAEKYDFIRLVEQENKGLSVARNKGLDLAKGAYIVFIDSDDFLDKDSLRKLLQKMMESDVDIIMGRTRYYAEGKERYSPYESPPDNLLDRIYDGQECFIRLMETRTFVPMAYNYLYRRSFIEKDKLRFVNTIHEDEIWTLFVLCSAEKALVTNIIFYNYRQREDSIVYNTSPEKRVRTLLFVADNIYTSVLKKRFNENKSLMSWIFVKIYELYFFAFKLLPQLNRYSFVLPDYSLPDFQWIQESNTKAYRICASYHKQATSFLNDFIRSRSDFFFTNMKKQEKAALQTLILIYNRMWDEPLSIQPKDIPQDCIITTDRQYLSMADAVVFHIPTLLGELEGDLDKRENQIWIAWSLECEENYPVLKDHEFMSLFDMHMSYHQYADIIYPYYEYSYFNPVNAGTPASEKMNKCCMIISSHVNQSKRIEFLEELMKYTVIDSFGKLFNNSVIENDYGRDSKLEIYSKYKFVIAFENSIAFDYVTEKFFDPFLAGTVPVYLGAPNIKEYAPGEDSFVDVRTFEDPRQLAGFMNKCYKDETLYSQFFNWKNKPLSGLFNKKIEKQKENPFVALCNKVRNEKLERIENEKEIASLGDIYFCTFADLRYINSLKRLKSQAEDMKVFKDIFICDERKLDESFKSFFSKYLTKEVRGYGYWVWKPYIIYKYLQRINDDDVLLYVDGGCHMNYRGKKRFLDYWKTVKYNKTGFLLGQLEPDNLERQWTKGDVLDYFDVRDNLLITETPQLQCGIVFVRKNEQTMKILKMWLSLYYSNFNLIDDSPSLSVNMDGFIEHRHDQSILSILLKKNGTSTFPVEEVYSFDNMWGFLERDSPILVRRDLK